VFSQENHQGQIEDYSNSQNGTLETKSSFSYLEENQHNKKVVFIIRTTYNSDKTLCIKEFNSLDSLFQLKFPGNTCLLIFHEIGDDIDRGQNVKSLYEIDINSSFQYLIGNPNKIDFVKNNFYEMDEKNYYRNKAFLFCAADKIRANFQDAQNKIFNSFSQDLNPKDELIVEKVVNKVKEKVTRDTIFLMNQAQKKTLFVQSAIGFFNMNKPIHTYSDKEDNQYVSSASSVSSLIQLGLIYKLWESDKFEFVQSINFSKASISFTNRLDEGKWEPIQSLDPYGNPFRKYLSVNQLEETCQINLSTINSSIGFLFNLRDNFMVKLGIGLSYNFLTNGIAINTAGTWMISGKYDQISEPLENIPELGLVNGINHIGEVQRLSDYSFLGINPQLGFGFDLGKSHNIRLNFDITYNKQFKASNKEFNYYPDPSQNRPIYNSNVISNSQIFFSCGLSYLLF
jgi:hypothetical protein